MPLGKKLQELRKNAGLTQGELGQILSISAQAISKWENGLSEPDISTLKRLAAIYNTTVAEIVDIDNCKESTVHTDAGAGANTNNEERPSIFDSFCDVYLTEINPEKKIATLVYIRDMLGISLVDAKSAVENLPYCISGMLDAETGKQIVSYLSEVDAKVVIDPCKGLQPRKTIISLTTPEPPKETHYMRNRFIIANITAVIPGIIVMVLMLMHSGPWHHYLLSIYVGISVYTTIFLLWYPTLTRKLLSPIGMLTDTGDGCLAFLSAGAAFILLLPWLIIVGLISPVIYAFSIKTRVVRMIEEDPDDDIIILQALEEYRSTH